MAAGSETPDIEADSVMFSDGCLEPKSIERQGYSLKTSLASSVSSAVSSSSRSSSVMVGC